MSSYDKVVKLACKPKNAPPKSKYIDNIIAATWSEDGAVHDVCKALAPRFREPNSIVVFKALIVLHTMIRAGATDNVLSFLSQSDVLKLRNVYTGSWEGFENPDHLHQYAKYMDCRIRAFRDLKHDVIKVQAESNRDARNSFSAEEEGYRSKKDASRNKGSNLARSKTMMGRKLRSMTVEKGLLRETRVVIQMMDSLVECRFYLDGVDDELRIAALRMLVRDLLILFQAANEAVINLLEQYFEMSHIDATEALAIYRHFCKLTEHVNEYLGVAKKLQNLLGVSIPHLGTAPVSLAKSLQEYLDDPNFESNRLEYKNNKAIVDGKAGPSKRKQDAASPPKSNTYTKPSTSTPDKPAASAATTQEQVKASLDDFFSSIEENQAPPQTTSPTGFLQQAPNPFSQNMNNQAFGFPQITAQPTGFLMPQHTAAPTNIAANPFGAAAQSSARPFSTFVPAQQQNFLQPQATGINPFRQSMLVPQTTGMALFGVGGNSGLSSPQSNPFPSSNQMSLQPMATGMFGQPFQPSQNPFGMTSSQSQPMQPAPASASSATPFGAPSAQVNVPPRPASTPLTAFNNSSTSKDSNSTSPPTAQPVKTHQTGTKNPFGPIVVTPPPPMPKGPTLMELAMGSGANSGAATGTNVGRSVSGPLLGTSTDLGTSQAGPSQTNGTSGSGFNFVNSALNPGGTDMASVASSFALANSKGNAGDKSGLGQNNGNMNTISATSSLPAGLGSGIGTSGSSLGSPTGAGDPAAALKPQMTGIAGLKPFKPTSSFGAALMESLPPMPSRGPSNATSDLGNSGSAPGIATNTGTNTANSTSQSPFHMGALNAQPTGFGGFNAIGNGTPGGSTTGTNSTTSPSTLSQTFSSNITSASRLGAGLRPQLTGGGAANPFRASMAAYGSGPGGLGGTNVPAVPPLPAGLGTNASTFGPFGGSMGAFGQQQQQPGAQGAQVGQNTASLI